MSQFANKNKNSSFYALLQLPGISINSVEIQQEAIIVNGKIKKKMVSVHIVKKRVIRYMVFIIEPYKIYLFFLSL